MGREYYTRVVGSHERNNTITPPLAVAARLTHRAQALREIARVLQPGGLVIIRTITPEAVRRRVPFRFFPTVADMEAMRMPTSSAIEALLGDAGFTMVQTEVVERHKALDFQAVLTEFQERPSARALTSEEFSQGLAAMREEWQLGHLSRVF